MLWLSMASNTFEFIGVGHEKHKPAMRNSVLSLHPITAEEREEAATMVYDVVPAREGETLAILSERSENVLSLDLTAAVNNLSVDEKLAEGQLVKIGKREPYQPGSTGGALE